MSSKLLQEAIADANKVKEIAYENAKAAIEEVFQPKIQRMISSKLAEEDFGDEMPADDEMELDVPAEEDEFPPMGESYMDDGKNGTPDNPLKDSPNPQLSLDDSVVDEEFDRIIRELEDADNLQEKDDAYKNKTGGSKKNIKNLGEGEDCATEEPAEEEMEESLDNLNLESLIKKLEEEEYGVAQQKASAQPASTDDAAALRAEVVRLTKENSQALEAIAKVKNTMNEVNLLNSKLMYCSKVIHSFDLTEAQQVKILETFDRAQSVREVKLIYATIHEHYKGRLSNRRSDAPKVVMESASRTIRTVKSAPKTKDQLMEGAERWQILSGQKPIND